MSIQEQDKMHGAVLVQIAEAKQFTGLNKPPGTPYGVYILNHDTPFMIKYAKGRGKWTFTFFPEHVQTARKLAAGAGKKGFYITLVCHPEAICILDWSDLAGLLDVMSKKPQALRCEIPEGKQIRVFGPGNVKLKRTVPRNDFPRRLFE